MMFEQLLKHIQGGGTTSVAALARQLAVSEALVEQMLAELERLGYLRAVDSCGQAGCTGCPQSAACQPRRAVRLWEVNEKTTTGGQGLR